MTRVWLLFIASMGLASVAPPSWTVTFAAALTAAFLWIRWAETIRARCGKALIACAISGAGLAHALRKFRECWQARPMRPSQWGRT